MKLMRFFAYIIHHRNHRNRSHIKLSILTFFKLISQIMEVVLDLMQRHMWEELFDHVDKEFENGIHSKIFNIIHDRSVFII